MRRSLRRQRKTNRRTKRRYISNRKYTCVKLRSKSKKHRRYGGAATDVPTGPMVLDPITNVMYSCKAM